MSVEHAHSYLHSHTHLKPWYCHLERWCSASEETWKSNRSLQLYLATPWELPTMGMLWEINWTTTSITIILTISRFRLWIMSIYLTMKTSRRRRFGVGVESVVSIMLIAGAGVNTDVGDNNAAKTRGAAEMQRCTVNPPREETYWSHMVHCCILTW